MATSVPPKFIAISIAPLVLSGDLFGSDRGLGEYCPGRRSPL
ncbi:MULTISPECIES: hypothetical protein [Cyanophyceae]|nr:MULTISPECIES: hypothetical protein [Cyanophyceae]